MNDIDLKSAARRAEEAARREVAFREELEDQTQGVLWARYVHNWHRVVRPVGYLV